MFCPNGEYNAAAQIFFRSPEEAVKALFHDPMGKTYQNKIYK